MGSRVLVSTLFLIIININCNLINHKDKSKQKNIIVTNLNAGRLKAYISPDNQDTLVIEMPAFDKTKALQFLLENHDHSAGMYFGAGFKYLELRTQDGVQKARISPDHYIPQ